jgi:signal peptidase I
MARKRKSKSSGPEGDPSGKSSTQGGAASPKGGASSAKAGEAHRAPPKPTSALWEWTKTIVFAVVLFLVVRTFLLQSFYISSGSMENTLLVGDVLMVNKVAYGAPIPGTHARLPGYEDPQRGEIAIFRPAWEPDVDVVKRVIGVPGDTLAMRNGTLIRDGKPQVEPYVVHDSTVPDETHPWMVWQYRYLAPGVDKKTYRPTLENWGPIVVPAHKYFVMGDNREHSLDSRFWGFLDRSRFEGKLAFLYWSYDTKSTLPLPFLTAVRWSRIGDSPGK